MQKYFKEPNHVAIGKRCTGEIKSLYKEKWQIVYEEADFSKNIKIGRASGNSKDILAIDLNTNTKKIFKSGAAVEREYNLPKNKITKTKARKSNHFIINNMDITVLE